MREAEPELITAKIASRWLSLSPWSLYQEVKAGRIPGVVRVGRRRVRFNRRILSEYIESGGSVCTGESKAEAAAQAG
jgi:predicted DNA-binding transcriptional regulator AlpA